MMIEVESLKELEPGKTYALQTSVADEEQIDFILKSMAEITAKHDIRFILFDETAKLIDAPVTVRLDFCNNG